MMYFEGKKVRIDKQGYYVFVDTGQRVHRSVMIRILGKPIPYGYVVHHQNRNKLDNTPSNLMLLTEREHRRIHRKIREHERALSCLIPICIMAGIIVLFIITSLLTKLFSSL